MLFLTKCPLRCGRNNPQNLKHDGSFLALRAPQVGLEIMSGEKEFPGGEVIGRSFGVREDARGFFVFRLDNELDSVTRTDLYGPYREQVADDVAAWLAAWSVSPTLELNDGRN